MIIMFGKTLVDENDNTLTEDGRIGGKPATLRFIAVKALSMVYQDEQSLSGEEKFKRYDLAMKIKADPVDLEVEEISLIKKLIGKAYGPVIVWQAWNILEGKTNE